MNNDNWIRLNARLGWDRWRDYQILKQASLEHSSNTSDETRKRNAMPKNIARTNVLDYYTLTTSKKLPQIPDQAAYKRAY